MKVLHLAPLWFSVSRDSPGGIETYLPALIAALEDHGCESTLMAVAGSDTAAELIEMTEENLVDAMESGRAWEYGPYEQHQLVCALERASDFEVIHSHLGYSGYVLSAIPGVADRVLHTQHNDVTPDLEWFIERHPDLLVSTVSEFQAAKLRRCGARRCHVIPNGLDLSKFPFGMRPGTGLVYLGRMEKEKGPDIAVRVAQELGLGLVLAGPVTNRGFFAAELEPWLDEKIRYVGVVNHAQKTRLLGEAACALVPSRWAEPFGLVAAEAMACGTPVAALANGGLPELIEPGVSGFVAGDEAELTAVTVRATQLDRAAVRAYAAKRFSMPALAARYSDLYSEMVTSASVTLGRP